MVWAPRSVVFACALACAPGVGAKPKLASPPLPPVIHTVQTYTPETYGDWQVTDIGGGTFIASTKNDAGFAFGSMCNSKGCFAFFNPQIACKDRSAFPALINAPGLAFNAEIECLKLDDIYVYTMSIEGGIADAMSIGGVIGIAFPMKSGQFRVARFSLTGSARATARAQQLAKPAPPARSEAKDSYTL